VVDAFAQRLFASDTIPREGLRGPLRDLDDLD
jgi:hypothetical protein